MIIIYESKTGFTKQYAELLGAETGYEVFSLKDALKLKKNGEAFFLGWIKIDKINGLKKANRRFRLTGVAGVGLTAKNETNTKRVEKKNFIFENFFYLQGGLDWNKIKGMNKFLMKMIKNTTINNAKNVENLSEEDQKMIDVLTNGGNFCCKENLLDIIAFIKG